jgi:LmeA-like phospholipid-binding
MRRLVVSVVVLVALLIGLDRLAVHVAEDLVAKRIQTEQHLSSRPDVSIGGFPFLTQAIAGRYDDVTLTVHGLSAARLRVRTVTAHLSGVHLSLGDVIARRVGSVPVDHASASVLVAYADLDTFLADRHITVARGAGGRARVTGAVTVAGHTVSVSAQAAVSVSDTAVVLTTDQGLDVTIPLPGLPFGLRLVSASADATGLTVAASAEGLVVHPGTFG